MFPVRYMKVRVYNVIQYIHSVYIYISIVMCLSVCLLCKGWYYYYHMTYVVFACIMCMHPVFTVLLSQVGRCHVSDSLFRRHPAPGARSLRVSVLRIALVCDTIPCQTILLVWYYSHRVVSCFPIDFCTTGSFLLVCLISYCSSRLCNYWTKLTN